MSGCLEGVSGGRGGSGGGSRTIGSVVSGILCDTVITSLVEGRALILWDSLLALCTNQRARRLMRCW